MGEQPGCSDSRRDSETGTARGETRAMFGRSVRRGAGKIGGSAWVLRPLRNCGVLFRVQADDSLDGSAADGAESDFVAREHDAVLLRAVVASGFVHRSFEGAYFAGVGS